MLNNLILATLIFKSLISNQVWNGLEGVLRYQQVKKKDFIQ